LFKTYLLHLCKKIPKFYFSLVETWSHRPEKGPTRRPQIIIMHTVCLNPKIMKQKWRMLRSYYWWSTQGSPHITRIFSLETASSTFYWVHCPVPCPSKTITLHQVNLLGPAYHLLCCYGTFVHSHQGGKY